MTSTSTIFVVAEPHDRAVAVVLGDLLDGEIEVFVPRGDHLIFAGFFCGLSGHKFFNL